MLANLKTYLRHVSKIHSTALDFLIKSAAYDNEWHDEIEETYRENKKPFDKFFGGEDRIYIPMNSSLEQVIEPPDDVLALIDYIAVLIPDLYLNMPSYADGLVTINDRPMRLGKFIGKVEHLLSKHNIEDESVKPLVEKANKAFITDRRRQVRQEKLVIVISQNPHDIAKMSTERAWRSCMTLPTAGSLAGDYYSDVFCEIREGGIISYVIYESDKEVKNPIARIHIRRFENQSGDSILVPEDSIYKSDIDTTRIKDEFILTVRKFCYNVNKESPESTYHMMGSTYTDTLGKIKNRYEYYNFFKNYSAEQMVEVINGKDREAFEQLVKEPDFDFSKLPEQDDLVYAEACAISPINILTIPKHRINNDLCMDILDKNLYAIKYMDQNPVLSKYAVERNSFLIRYIENQTPELCWMAIKQNADNIAFIKDKKPEYCIEAVELNAMSLRHIRKQTREICLAAVRNYGMALQYVNNQTTEICMEAIANEPDAFIVVKDKNPEICMFAVKVRGTNLKHVKNQTPELCWAALNQNPESLIAVKNQTPEMCMYAIEKNPACLQYVRNQTIEMVKLALTLNPDTFIYVADDLKRRAVEFMSNQA